MSNIWNHFRTITHHKMLVMKHCFRLGMYKQGLLHDNSKYSPAEFIPGCIYYAPGISPHNISRKKIGYSAAWLHHKGRNKHHFEYWIDYSTKDGDTKLAGMKMPMKYVVEMFVDRMCACKNYLGKEYQDDSALNYYLKSKKHYVMHKDTTALLEELLYMNAQQGEEKTFAYIKTRVLTGKRKY
ncbi:MAG: DUF5662 family protein [Lachnospiraceae bacterium]|nr:DUF5662 family protein [Lachnospiraceae bacterium]